MSLVLDGRRSTLKTFSRICGDNTKQKNKTSAEAPLKELLINLFETIIHVDERERARSSFGQTHFFFWVRLRKWLSEPSLMREPMAKKKNNSQRSRMFLLLLLNWLGLV